MPKLVCIRNLSLYTTKLVSYANVVPYSWEFSVNIKYLIKYFYVMEELTLYEYKLLPVEKQYVLVFNEGQFLDTFEKGTSRFALYALYKFFVEVEYDVNNNEIVNKVSFITGEKLDRYSNLNL